MIKDLFSHKIHSSSSNWPDKLVELAYIFFEFDGQIYSRDLIEERLKEYSPRASYVARDPSKFRDEYSAYHAYFGLYRLDKSSTGWILRVNETTKRFLLVEEPDVPAFLRIQLALFQYPNTMGIAYNSVNGDCRLRLQANSRERTLDFIKNDIHLCPLRLIVRALKADSILKNCALIDAFISFKEIFALANHEIINKQVAPDLTILCEALVDIREGRLLPPDNFESRFHLLDHLDLFKREQHGLKLRPAIDSYDNELLVTQINTILNIEIGFNGFDNINNSEELHSLIESGQWQKYFDGVRTLNSEIVNSLSTKDFKPTVIPQRKAMAEKELSPDLSPSTYPLTERSYEVPTQKATKTTNEYADPEITRIKRQRRNFEHKLLIEKMETILRSIGAVPKDNPHIDLYSDIPQDGAFIFEMKSGGENFLDQIRKGISQLYEYRFRYSKYLPSDISLCLVLPFEPKNIPWLDEYLCLDRGISYCWFDADNNIQYPSLCDETLSKIISLAPSN
jgi:hypothetical protein